MIRLACEMKNSSQAVNSAACKWMSQNCVVSAGARPTAALKYCGQNPPSASTSMTRPSKVKKGDFRRTFRLLSALEIVVAVVLIAPPAGHPDNMSD